MKIKVSDLVAKFLVENGIEDVFAITGGGAMHLDDSLGHHPDLKMLFNHHEQACSIAAEGYAKYSGKLPAVCVTSGPGGTNAITGVLCAWLDSIPMFVISGQVKRSTTTWASDLPLRQVGDQEYNIIASVNDMTKYAIMITDEKEILYHLEKALYLCRSGRPGPVWIDIPLDVQKAMVEEESLRHYDELENIVEVPEKIEGYVFEEILRKIEAAKSPVILAGTGIRIGNAHREFIDFINKLQIPVVTAWNAHDVLPDDHYLYCGRPGTVGTRGGNFVVQNSDLIIVLGSRLNIRQISYNWENFANKAYKIMVDIDPAEMSKHTLNIDMKIHADVKCFMKKMMLYTYNINENHSKWLAWCKSINTKYPVVLDHYYDESTPINPYVFMKHFFKSLSHDEVVVTSNGSACVISFQAAIIKKKTRLFTNSGCAPMGYGLPAAMGVCVQRKNKRVICIEGDGSIQMNIQELQTIVYNNLDVKIIWLNNDGYHSIRQTQNNLFKPPIIGVNKENGLSFPSAERIAAAYGITYYRIEDVSQIENITATILAEKGPCICEVLLDPNQYFEPKLSSKISDDGTIVSPSIEDMFPFLSREEYETIKYE